MMFEILALVVSYLGIFIGKYLSKAAKEEVEAGRRNLKIFKWIIFALIIFYFCYTINLSLMYTRLSLIGLILIYLLTRNYYAVLGAIFGANPTFLMSVLIFIYGFPTGSLMKEKYFRILKKTWVYLLLGLIFLIIRNSF